MGIVNFSSPPNCYTASMPDTSGHDQPQHDERHTIPLRELEVRLAAEGVLMSRRQITRHCEGGTFDAKKLPAVNNVMEWFVAPASIDKGIADIKTLQELRARRDASRPDMSGRLAVDRTLHDRHAAPGHVAPRLDVTTAPGPQHEPDATRHDALRPDATDHDALEAISIDGADTAGHGETRPDHVDPSDAAAKAAHRDTSLNIFEHPYVLRLEDRIDRLEAKYEAQVRRTEEIQIKSQERLVELQRMTAVGQSQTLADFMLKAKDWMLGAGQEETGREGEQHAA